MSDERRTIWCGNLADKVTEEILYELFLQAAPLERVRIPSDSKGRKSNYAFITVKHEVSVDYAVQLLDGTSLFNRCITVKPRVSSANQQNDLYNRECGGVGGGQDLMTNFDDLFKMGQLMQLNYNLNEAQNRGRNRESHNRKDYNKYRNYQDNYNSPRYGRNNSHRGYDRSQQRHKPY